MQRSGGMTIKKIKKIIEKIKSGIKVKEVIK